MKGHDRRRMMLPVCIEAKDLANMKLGPPSFKAKPLLWRHYELSDLKPHGQVASGEIITCHQYGDEPLLPSLQVGQSFETETVRSNLWIPFEVRQQGRLGAFPKWFGSHLGCCHSVNTAERRSREYSFCRGYRTLSHSTTLGTNTVKSSNSGEGMLVRDVIFSLET